MVYEKIFTTLAGRQVKVILRGYYSHLHTDVEPYIEILVKEHMESSFCIPAGLDLPKYGSYEQGNQEWTRDQVVKVSCISDQEYNQVVAEFKEITNSSVLW